MADEPLARVPLDGAHFEDKLSVCRETDRDHRSECQTIKAKPYRPIKSRFDGTPREVQSFNMGTRRSSKEIPTYVRKRPGPTSSVCVLSLGTRLQLTDTIMSDSEHSAVTYTSASEDDLYMGSPGVEVPVFEGPPSPDYVPGPEEPEQAPPSPIYIPFVPEPVYPEFLPVDDEVFPAEEQPLPAADSPTHQSPGLQLFASSLRQDPYIAYPVAAKSIRTQAPTTDSFSYEVAERVLALPTPPPSPLSPYSSPLPQIPSPPLPIPPPPLLFPLPVLSADLDLLQLSNLYGFTDMLEAAPGRQMSRELGYGIRDTWDDLVGAIQEIAPTTLEGVNQRVIELSSTVTQEDEIIYSHLMNATVYRALLELESTWGGVGGVGGGGGGLWDNDRPFHRRTALLIEEEARLSRAAWARSMDACDQVHSEGMSLRTTVMAQQSEIVELRAADQRRQTVISELLKADYRRQRQLAETLKIVKSLKAQMTELQRQQGPAKDPAEPELPEEAGSSS
ncbi:hypothetical protein Tco_0086687 [Tanacetum coccineum]